MSELPIREVRVAICSVRECLVSDTTCLFSSNAYFKVRTFEASYFKIVPPVGLERMRPESSLKEMLLINGFANFTLHFEKS